MPFYQLHPDVGMNFQINRVLTYGEQAGCLKEIQAISAKIHNFETWHTEWKNLAIKAENDKRYLHAAYGYRMAEFFLTEDHPEKTQCYESFIRCFYQAVNPDDFERFDLPYEGKSLPAMRFQASNEKGAIVVHGGYDSFMEEFYLTVKQLPFILNAPNTVCSGAREQGLFDSLRLTNQTDQPAPAETAVRATCVKLR